MKKDNRNTNTLDWDKLATYLSGEMQAKEKDDFEHFLAQNPVYQNVLASASGDADDTLNFETSTAWEKLSSKIKTWDLAQKQHNKIKRKIPQSFYRIAVVALALVCLSIPSYFLLENAQTKERLFTASSTEQNKSITLNDGTVVYLNAHAKLYYTKVFKGLERKVRFEGEGFFDVAKNKDKPFVIETYNAKVAVLGTSFNLRGTSSMTEVMVSTGHVTLSKPDDSSTTLHLKQGEMGILKDNKVMKSLPTNTNYLSWRTQQMVFKNTPLTEVFKVIENTYAVDINMDANTDDKFYFTATFDHEPLDILLESIGKTFHLSYTKQGQTILFTKKE